jgi:hypothetical protein
MLFVLLKKEASEASHAHSRFNRWLHTKRWRRWEKKYADNALFENNVVPIQKKSLYLCYALRPYCWLVVILVSRLIAILDYPLLRWGIFFDRRKHL